MNKISNTIVITVIALFFAACSSTKDDHAMKNYSFPAEWEKHEGTWLIWPHDYGVIMSDYVDMIEDIWSSLPKRYTQVRESISLLIMTKSAIVSPPYCRMRE